MTGKHRDLDELLGAVAAGERVPGVVADAVLVDELVDGAQQRRVGVVPPFGLRTRRDPADLVGREAGHACDRDVLRPLVAGAASERGAEDDQLPVARRELAAREELAAERQPLAHEAGIARHRQEDVELRTVAPISSR